MKVHCKGHSYRISTDSGYFGQIIKDGRHWRAEIRVTDTGEFKEYAGIHNTLKEAREEIEWTLTPRKWGLVMEA